MAVHPLTSHAYKKNYDVVAELLKSKNLDINAHNQGTVALAFALSRKGKDMTVAKMLLSAPQTIVDTNTGKTALDMVNNALNWNIITLEQYNQLIRYPFGKKEFKAFSHPASPLKQLPPEVQANIFEFSTEQPLSPVQRERLMRRK